MPSQLVGRVAALADGALDALAPGPAREQVSAVRRGLDQPLRVAIAGREKAGKSTLVNALLEQRVAPTDASVCTKVVTWFVHGHGQRIEIRSRAGDVREAPLRRNEDGAAVIDLGADPSEIDRVTIRLESAVLEDMTLIDTPGLSSVSELDGATKDLLFVDAVSREASEKADALIFLLSPTVMEDDREALLEFMARFGGLHASAGNAIGIISRADQLGDGSGDPWPTAQRLAAKQTDALAGLVSSVVPVVGLLAESMPYLRETDVDHLEALARMPPAVRDSMLLDSSLFLHVECPVPHDARRRLLRLLEMYGLRLAFEAIDQGITGASRMARHIEERSGIAEVRRLVLGTFAARSDVLRAGAALAALRTIGHSRDPENARALATLRNEVERLELDPVMHRLEELRAGELAREIHLELPAELREDLHRLLTETAPTARLGVDGQVTAHELKAAAEKQEMQWRAFENDPHTSGVGRRVAHVFARSHALIWSSLVERSTVG